MSTKSETSAAETETAQVEETATQAKKKSTAKAAAKKTESTYAADEFASNAKALFGTTTECVAAALKLAGISECTLTQAQEVVEAFRKKEVK